MKYRYNIIFSIIILIFVMFFSYAVLRLLAMTNLSNIHFTLSILSFVIILVLLFTFSIKGFKQNINKANYFKSLLLPITYFLVNIIDFSIFVDKSTGWEYELGLQATLIWSLLFFVIIASTNLVILKRHKN